MKWAAIIKPLNNNLVLKCVALSIALTYLQKSPGVWLPVQSHRYAQERQSYFLPLQSKALPCACIRCYPTCSILSRRPPPIYFPLRDWKTHPFVSWILTAVVTYITDRLLSYCAWALLPCLDEKLHRQLCCFLWKEKCIMTKISGLEITLPGFLVSLQQYLFYNFGKS